MSFSVTRIVSTARRSTPLYRVLASVPTRYSSSQAKQRMPLHQGSQVSISPSGNETPIDSATTSEPSNAPRVLIPQIAYIYTQPAVRRQSHAIPRTSLRKDQSQPLLFLELQWSCRSGLWGILCLLGACQEIRYLCWILSAGSTNLARPLHNHPTGLVKDGRWIGMFYLVEETGMFSMCAYFQESFIEGRCIAGRTHWWGGLVLPTTCKALIFGLRQKRMLFTLPRSRVMNTLSRSRMSGHSGRNYMLLTLL